MSRTGNDSECPYCGNEIDHGLTHCPKCSHTLEWPESPETVVGNEGESNKFGGPKWYLFLGLLFFVLGLYSVFTREWVGAAAKFCLGLLFLYQTRKGGPRRATTTVLAVLAVAFLVADIVLSWVR